MSDKTTASLKPGPRFDPSATYQVKAALFDVDNTLVGNEVPDLPSERFHQAVQAARGKISVGLASARPLSKVRHILDFIGAEGICILCNGAQLVDSRSEQVIAEWPITMKTCLKVVDGLRDMGVRFWINDGGVDHFPDKKGSGFQHRADLWNTDSPRIEVPGYRPAKPYVIVVKGITDKQIIAVEQLVKACHDQTTTTLIAHEIPQPDGNKLFDLFVVNRHANKRDALHELLSHQKLSVDQLMAVGDGRNDAVLIGAAGVGVAMGNSAAETLAVATHVAPNQWDDGAAIALEHTVRLFAITSR